MDPNACFKRYLDAVEDDELDEAFYASRDLAQWILNGGHCPTGFEDRESFFITLVDIQLSAALHLGVEIDPETYGGDE